MTTSPPNAEPIPQQHTTPNGRTEDSAHSTVHSALRTPHSALEDEPGALAAFGALLLVAGLIVCIFWGMGNPGGERLRTENQASVLLADGRYSETAQLLERAVLHY